MAYSYTLLHPANTMSVSLTQGDVLRYAGVLLNVNTPMNGFNVTTSFVTYAIEQGWLSYVEAGASIAANTPASDLYVQSGTPDVTLTDKTKAFATGIMSTVNAIIAKVNSLTGRMTAVETLAASKAAINDNTLYSTTETLSSSKINEAVASVYAASTGYTDSAVQTAKNDVISQLSGVDGTQLQALNDLSAALQANTDADGVIANDLLNKVDFSKAQSLTDAQAAQARANIKFDTAVNAAVLATVGDVTLFNPDAILATALTLN